MSQVITNSSAYMALCVQPVKWLSVHPQGHLVAMSLPYKVTHFCTQLSLAACTQQHVSVTQALCSLLNPVFP